MLDTRGELLNPGMEPDMKNCGSADSQEKFCTLKVTLDKGYLWKSDFSTGFFS
jgi:hypothetical protein